MPKLLHISVAIELPADEWEGAGQACVRCAVKPAWDIFIETLDAAGVKYVQKIDTSEIRAPRARRSDIGVKRSSKPRQQPALAAGPDKEN